MYKLLYVFLISSVGFVYSVTPAQQCEGENFEDLQERIQVSSCRSKNYCELVKEQNTTVIFKFKPKEVMKTVINEVSAKLMGDISLPFLGVDKTSACDHILYAADNTPAKCPLEPNVEYLYKNVFYIHVIYPELSMTVQWSLKDGDRKAICFVVPAKIVKNKKKKSH